MLATQRYQYCSLEPCNSKHCDALVNLPTMYIQAQFTYFLTLGEKGQFKNEVGLETSLIIET